MNTKLTSMDSVDNPSQDSVDGKDGFVRGEEYSTPPPAVENEPNALSEEESKTDLPEPDRENITVFTNKLPDKPILPWNRYDSPWREEEEAENGAKDVDSEGEIEEDEVE